MFICYYTIILVYLTWNIIGLLFFNFPVIVCLVYVTKLFILLNKLALNGFKIKIEKSCKSYIICIQNTSNIWNKATNIL